MCRSRGRSRVWLSQVVKLTTVVLLVLQIVVLGLSIKPNEDYISRLENENATSSQSSKVWKLATYSVDGLMASTALLILIVVACDSYFLVLVLAIPFILFTLFLTILTLVKAILYSKTLFVDVAAVILSLGASFSMLLFAAMVKKRSSLQEQRAKKETEKRDISSPLLQPKPNQTVVKSEEVRPSEGSRTSLTPDNKRTRKLSTARSGSAMELREQMPSQTGLQVK